jgi:enamine deaminase RidA (YjgF/YER057c/UK114 family)
MAKIEKRLSELGLVLPAPPTPMGAYVPALTVGNLVFISGQLPREGDRMAVKGKVDTEVRVGFAKQGARLAALNCLAVLKAEIGDLDRVKRIVRLTGHVASVPGFIGQPEVMNGASELMVEVFGERGRHTRMTLGVPVLPSDATVAVEMIAEIEEKKVSRPAAKKQRRKG